jgi:hypothetical protein
MFCLKALQQRRNRHSIKKGTPLLERFEAEHGTLTAIALFVGRECSGKMQCLWPFC